MSLDNSPELQQISRRTLIKGFIATGLTLATAEQQPAAAQQQIAAPRHLLGIAGHAWWFDRNPRLYLDSYRDLGVTGVRLALDWKRFEQRAGVYDFSLYDRVLPTLFREGYQITGNFVTVPAWASSNPEGCLRDQTRYCDLPPAREPQLRAAIRAAVSRYPFIKDWEVGNEPEMWQYLGQNPDDYLRILRIFYTEAKAINPNNQVAAATLLGRKYLEQLYDLAPDKPWDAATIHPYGGGAVDGRVQPADLALDDPGTNQRTGEIDLVRALLLAKGDGHKKVWVTEYGWERDPVQQAQSLNAMLSWMATRPWIGAAHLHMLHDVIAEDGLQRYGVTRPDPLGDITQQTRFVPKEPFYGAFKHFPRS